MMFIRITLADYYKSLKLNIENTAHALLFVANYLKVIMLIGAIIV